MYHREQPILSEDEWGLPEAWDANHEFALIATIVKICLKRTNSTYSRCETQSPLRQNIYL